LGSACREGVGKFVLEDFGGDLIFEKVRGGKGGQTAVASAFGKGRFFVSVFCAWGV
jgi:hypothetical protein